MAFDVVILGPPGAGKGTQAKRICEEMSMAHIATGDMLRDARAEGSELGSRIKSYMDAGDLVPDDLMIELIRARLAGAQTAPGSLLDGFPRTLVQAEALDTMLEQIGPSALALALHLQISDEVAAERLLRRANEEQRTDDTPEVIQRRLDVFRAQTEPLVAYYRARGILVGIHGERTVDEVFAEIQAVLEQAADR